jgi:hypothetical protein
MLCKLHLQVPKAALTRYQMHHTGFFSGLDITRRPNGSDIRYVVPHRLFEHEFRRKQRLPTAA